MEARVDLNEVVVFARVVEAGSFTAAAQLLSLPKSTVSAKVAALERRLGVALLQRTTRRLRVTSEGEAFFKACARGLADIEAAEAHAVSGSRSPRGPIRVTTSVDLGVRFMPGFLAGFLTKYPEISVDLILTGRTLDLLAEGVDVGIRAGVMKDSSLIARKVTTSRFRVVASPAYLARVGTPKHPRDLAGHECVRHSRTQPGAWRLSSGRQTVSVDVKGRAAADELSAVRELVRAGLGIGLFPEFVAEEDVRDGRLRVLLPDWHAHQTSVYVVFPEQKFQHPRVRVFVQEVADALRSLSL
jgi:DNA-binding transcriptional LysR family regulator